MAENNGSSGGRQHGHSVKDLKKSELQSRFQRIGERLKNLEQSQDDLLLITENSLEQLQTKLQENSLSPLNVLHGYQAKCLQLINEEGSGICEFIREAEEQAIQLKERRSPLYGIPVSVKELCCVKGYDATFGLWKYCQKPSTEDSVVVKVLREMGVIPFVLTATSHMAFTTSGFNPIFGNMTCPSSSNHEPGGSSNGEAVLISKGGSPVGLGTDIAGSIRIPSAFCGLCGLKPTIERISNRGLAELAPHSCLVQVAVGPMGKNVDDLVQMMRTLLQPIMYKYDPTIPPMQFDESVFADTGKLTIGYYDTLADPNIVQTVPSVRHAVEKAAECLRAQGHNVIEFKFPEVFVAYKLALQAFSVDGGDQFKQSLAGEPTNEYTKVFKQIISIPDTLRNLVDYATAKAYGKQAALTKYARRMKNAVEVMVHIEKMKNYRKDFLDSLADFDALLCPVWSTPATHVDTPPQFVNPSVVYTILYNMLNLPAGVVSVTKVEESDLNETKKLMETYKASGDKFHEKLCESQLNSRDLPVAVQVVGKPFQEEMVLRVMKLIQDGCV